MFTKIDDDSIHYFQSMSPTTVSCVLFLIMVLITVPPDWLLTGQGVCAFDSIYDICSQAYGES